MQNDMAAQLLDSNGNLKPFEQWKNDVQSIASHQCRSWLETEYNTAVLRAHQAADWQQFLQEADVLPNLKWMPSTSPNPGADHMPFWGTILPIDDPFWDQHRPGDRWNCKCSLTSTDEPTTPVPSVAVSQQPKNTPQRGLENNPGKDAAVFSDKHPYFPKSCNACPFYKSEFKAKLKQLFTNRAKDCYNCPYINGCVDRAIAKREIDNAAWVKKQEVKQNNLMPAQPDRTFTNLTTGTIHQTGKARNRFLKHLHHDYDVDAAIHIWEHLEKLNYVRISPLGEDKDMTLQKNIDNVQNKRERGVIEYVIYRFTYNGRTFLAKTEKLKHGNEQLYSLYEE